MVCAHEGRTEPHGGSDDARARTTPGRKSKSTRARGRLARGEVWRSEGEETEFANSWNSRRLSPR
eukprot:scaffold7876_cov67-Phaeocystis_antarctica.AAC.20